MEYKSLKSVFFTSDDLVPETTKQVKHLFPASSERTEVLAVSQIVGTVAHVTTDHHGVRNTRSLKSIITAEPSPVLGTAEGKHGPSSSRSYLSFPPEQTKSVWLWTVYQLFRFQSVVCIKDIDCLVIVQSDRTSGGLSKFVYKRI